MAWCFMCPGCFKMIEIDDFGKSTPTAEIKLVNGVHCGNCGRDVTSSYERALEVIREINMEREQHNKNQSDA